MSMSDKKSPNISPQHREYIRKVKRRKRTILLTQISLLILFFALWEIAARIGVVDPFISSQPTRIMDTVLNLYRDGELFNHIAITCVETMLGFILGTLIGILVAIILWWSEFLEKVMEPYLVVLNSLPKIALGPIFIVWIGAGSSAIVVIAMTISVVVTIVKTFGANRIQILTKVVLPSSLPVMVNALKVSVGLSWVGVIVGEFLVSKAGLGYLIVYGGQVFQLDLVMASVIILSIAAFLMYRMVAWIEKLVVKRN
jgi:NitT/TauT family transport system permease protein